MTSNLYFAYSIKRDFNGLVSLLPALLPPILEKKKKKTRACDACSVRKTKCDESRPCRHCVNNNLECTELRQRKKLGPKNLRKKTIDSIQSLHKDSQTQSPEKDELSKTAELSGSDFGNAPELCVLVPFLQSLPSEVLAAVAPLTVPGFHQTATDILAQHATLPPTLPDTAKKLAAFAYVACLFVVHLSHSPNNLPISISDLQRQVQHLYAECARLQIFQDLNGLDFDSLYYLALAEAHLYGMSRLMQASSRELVHLKGAVSYLQLLAAHHNNENPQVIDLHSLLFVWERHAYLFSLEPAFRNMGTDLGKEILNLTLSSGPNSILGVYSAMLTSLDQMLIFQHVVPEPYGWRYQGCNSGVSLSYSTIKMKLRETLDKVLKTSLDPIAQHLKFVVLLKAIQVYLTELCQQQTSLELLELIQQLNAVLDPSYPELRLYILVLGITPQMLEALRLYLHVTSGQQLGPHVIDSLLQLSSCISFYTGHTFEVSDPILTDWFGRLIGPPNLLLESVLN